MIREWEQKDWIQRRNVLDKMLLGTGILKYFTTKRYSERIAIEGDIIPMIFGDDGKLYIWSRGSRYSGREISVSDLVKIESVVTEWLEIQKVTDK